MAARQSEAINDDSHVQHLSVSLVQEIRAQTTDEVISPQASTSSSCIETVTTTEMAISTALTGGVTRKTIMFESPAPQVKRFKVS